MKKQDKIHNKALLLLNRVIAETEHSKPSREQMIEDIKMMSFKIRNVSGDIFRLPKEKGHIIESLWRVGKIEQVINSQINDFSKKEKQTFFGYLASYERQIKDRVNRKVESLPAEIRQNMKLLSFEIFRKHRGKRND